MLTGFRVDSSMSIFADADCHRSICICTEREGLIPETLAKTASSSTTARIISLPARPTAFDFLALTRHRSRLKGIRLRWRKGEGGRDKNEGLGKIR